MLRVGITGGIGSGKTALTDWLSTQGIVIVDADLAARAVVEPGQPALAKITEAFGAEFLLPDGQLDRAALRQRVFSDENQRKALEAITHPRIRDELVRHMSVADSPYVVLSSPLLLENSQSDMVDVSVVVDVPETLQIERTMARDQNNRQLVDLISPQDIHTNPWCAVAKPSSRDTGCANPEVQELNPVIHLQIFHPRKKPIQ